MIDPDKPTDEPAQFFGQRSVVRRIYSRIGAERPQSVAVIGGPKSGKTSLLNYLAHRSVLAGYLDNPDSYTLCNIPSSEAIAEGPESFITGVGRLLPGAGATGENHYDFLSKEVERIHDAGGRLVLLLDDFHNITRNSRFPLEFFSFLRSLANNYNLAYVTTSFLELQKLCVVKDIEESPFFNIFTNVSLGTLTTEEATELLTSITGERGDRLRDIVLWAGPAPYLVKRIAARLSKAPHPAEAPMEDFLPVLQEHFEEVVSILPQDAYNALRAVAKGKNPDPKDSHQLRPMLKNGFLKEKGGAIVPFSPAFGLFLKGKLSKKMLGRG